MSRQLPRQLPWRDFLKLLRKLGYTLRKSNRGAARTFENSSRSPRFVTFHEPHSKPKVLKQGTLREYLRKLELERDDFFSLLGRR